MSGSHHHHQHEHEHDHDDHHGHDHSHGHHGHVHAPKDFGKPFAIGVFLNGGFVIVEAVFGFLSNSLSLLTDAGHNLGDVLGLLLAWGASVLANRRPSARFTYGLRSTSILAALINAALLLLATGAIGWEAVSRLMQPVPVEGGTVTAVAVVGVVINTATALMFMSGRKDDLNVRAAFLHMAADAAITLGVALSGIAIIFTGWQWLDPVTSLVVAVLVIAGTWGLLRDSVNLALHAVPPGIDPAQVQALLASFPGVTEVHDLHIWAMSTTDTALTAHLVCPAGYPGDALHGQIAHELKTRFRIGHSTIQIETGDPAHPCELAPAHVV
ncbi:MAG TPA: cation diffusion facilitator family transporter [Noviherbaspirillum sp.]